MKRISLIYCLILSSCLYAQRYKAELINTHPLSVERFVGADKYRSIYYIEDRTLYKNGAGPDYEFAALNLGEITYVDLLNPLKITVFYKQSNTAVILDNTLNEITRVEFSSIENFRNVSMATTANDRRLWIFNTDLQQLELFDYRLDKVIIEFPPLAQMPTVYTSDFNFCWLQTPSELITYNIYGTIIEENNNNISYDRIVQNQEVLVALKDGQFYIRTNSKEPFTDLGIRQNTVQEFSLIGEILYIYNGQNLMTYTIKPI